MLNRFLAVIISAIILALGISAFYYVPPEQRDPDVYYFGIVEYFSFALYIYLVFFVMVGIPVSWLIDKCRKSYRKKTIINQYFIGVMLYSLTGLFLGTVYHFVMDSNQFHVEVFIETIGFWFNASFVYFHVLWALEKEFLRKR